MFKVRTNSKEAFRVAMSSVSPISLSDLHNQLQELEEFKEYNRVDGMHESLICISFFAAGYISGIRSEREKRREAKIKGEAMLQHDNANN